MSEDVNQKSTTIVVPPLNDCETVISFCDSLDTIEYSETYIFDFSRIGFTTPFCMLYASIKIRNFIDKRSTKTNKFAAIGHRDDSYPAYMGFYHSMNLSVGLGVGQAPGSSTHIPIKKLVRADIEKEAADKNIHTGQVVEGIANQIAKTLTQKSGGDVVESLTFSTREIIRNFIEHSEADYALVCGQYWPTKHIVEVAIIDNGRGIKEALSDNERHEYDSDREAIHIAIMPGVSGNRMAGKDTNDYWQNSGFGLYMTSRICRQGGEFYIYSKSAGLKLALNSKMDLKCNVDGVGIRMIMDTRTVKDIEGKLKQFSYEGSLISKEFSGYGRMTPSVASTMLSKNFESLDKK